MAGHRDEKAVAIWGAAIDEGGNRSDPYRGGSGGWVPDGS
jgi:hypothetical protein